MDASKTRVPVFLNNPFVKYPGFSAYPRTLDYKRFKEICEPHNAILLSDMAHVTGLVAAEMYANPFDYSDVVTCTTHKTLRGPRLVYTWDLHVLEAL